MNCCTLLGAHPPGRWGGGASPAPNYLPVYVVCIGMLKVPIPIASYPPRAQFSLGARSSSARAHIHKLYMDVTKRLYPCVFYQGCTSGFKNCAQLKYVYMNYDP